MFISIDAQARAQMMARWRQNRTVEEVWYGILLVYLDIGMRRSVHCWWCGGMTKQGRQHKVLEISIKVRYIVTQCAT